MSSELEKPDDISERTIILLCHSENINENDNHTEEVIIGSEQGTMFPTKIGTTMCNALIDTGATRSCMSKKYYKKIAIGQNSFIAKYQCKIGHW